MITTRSFVTYHDSPVGTLQIKSSAEAIHAILFVNAWKGPKLDEDEMRDSGHSALVKLCTAQLDEYFEGKRRVFDFPFTQEGTAFQQKIWNALLEIPFGRTISYMELAKRTGNIKAIRAVGTTNGKNQLSIVVPCHRVIGANGSLVGYGGDLWRKKWLLDHEAKYAYGVQELGDW
ncbi:methylated-DNA--[protein]-cysteine S-methyltransferase [Agriterribacter sp.]|uniref:methylated-DNA--[protein]-cysteine S-methyltransferase n=1 Tax=Agriterribacter sp. TaxID=2821509 RepID=UPI002C186B66|nr:methylated-DNA--[protein]-cysteine S-methyltransferase [Agriterribacter sp.]HRP57088.1 methylated-DNA--[protein]-cysteine S-methyltransferase [Agriterribacter sp.]